MEKNNLPLNFPPQFFSGFKDKCFRFIGSKAEMEV